MGKVKTNQIYLKTEGYIDNKKLADINSIDKSNYTNGEIVIDSNTGKEYKLDNNKFIDYDEYIFYVLHPINSFIIKYSNEAPKYGTWELINYSLIQAGDTLQLGTYIGEDKIDYTPTIKIEADTKASLILEGTSLTASQIPSHSHQISLSQTNHSHTDTVTCASDSHTHTVTDSYLKTTSLYGGSGNYGIPSSNTSSSRTTSSDGGHSHNVTITNASATAGISLSDSNKGSGASHTHTATVTDQEYTITTDSFVYNGTIRRRNVYIFKRTK